VPGTAGGITEINSANNIVFATAPWAHGSNGGIAITPDGSRMYVNNADVSSVSVFDTATNVPLMEIGVGQNPIGLAITPDGSHAYVSSQGSDTVSVIALATNSVVKTISVGAGANPIWVTISRDGSRAYVSNQGGGTISVIDTASNTVLTNIPIGSLPFHSAFSRDGRFLWVSVQGAGGFTLDNYVTAFSRWRYVEALGNSLILGLSVGALCTVFGVPMAWAVSRTDMPGKGFVRAIILGAFITPSYLGAIGWILLAGPNAGWLNRIWMAATGSGAAHRPSTTNCSPPSARESRSTTAITCARAPSWASWAAWHATADNKLRGNKP